MGKTMNSNFAAFLAMTAMVSATACGQKSSDTDTSENAGEVIELPDAEAIANAPDPFETETTADYNRYFNSELSLDCTLGFEQLTADAIAIDGMIMAQETDDQLAYMTPEGVSFTMTKEAHFAHPMIVRRDIIVGEGEAVANGDDIRIDMAACGYGEKEASDRMMYAFALLNERFMLQEKVRVVEE